MIQITISVDDNGGMKVEGIIPDKVIMYGIMKTAEKVLDKYYDAKESKARIAPAKLIGGHNPLASVSGVN